MKGTSRVVQGPRRSARAAELSAVGAFALFVTVVLLKLPTLLEPDDFAYRASIVALSHGQILLTNTQYIALGSSLISNAGPGVLQWHHLASGYWISEKNPGYPFFAVLFYALDLLRPAPLFYGALACTGIFIGVRRWVSERAAQIAVWLYCFSGAALTFAWRSTMPSFSDASLVAAGFGLLVWVLIAAESSHRRRLWVGLVAFVALESTVFIRYTNLLELGVAVLAPCSALRPSAFVVRGSSIAGLIVLIVSFNQWAYGSATSTGYSSGEITFSLASFWPNLKGMPSYLTTSLPIWLLAAAALTVIAARHWRHRTAARDNSVRTHARVATVLAGGWLGLWLTYFCHTWTVGQIAGGHASPSAGISVHVIRFHLPAFGPMAMLAAWLINRFVHAAMVATAGVLVIAALYSFQAMASGPGAAQCDPVGSDREVADRAVPDSEASSLDRARAHRVGSRVSVPETPRDSPERCAGHWLSPRASRYLGEVTEDTTEFDAQAELEYLRQTPAEELLANHFFVLAQWAAVHLAASPADLDGAQLVIDVMAAVLDASDNRLGANRSLYRTALAEIQQVFVRASLAGASSSRVTPGDEAPEA